ncbi:MAG: hypothetical protein QM781_17670 [Chitinophagaceae bacterium]
MKLLVTLLGLLNGGYMFIDGIHVLLKGKYIGPEKPGPWAHLFYKMGADVYKLGPLFIAFGVIWMAWLISFWTRQPWSYGLGICICLLTLWYLPAGTIFSLIILGVLLFSKSGSASLE